VKDDPFFWISDGEAVGEGTHVAFRVKTRAEVDAFHAAALAAGGKDNGAPGLRDVYGPNYYAAFVHDFDGINIEAVCHQAD
jgi:catechol 2,3-dioxygenase-like lactoylglutathione lyase family enzyme